MRETTSPDWTDSVNVGNVTGTTLDIAKDNLQFGLRAVDTDGNRSPVAFPHDRNHLAARARCGSYRGRVSAATPAARPRVLPAVGTQGGRMAASPLLTIPEADRPGSALSCGP